MADNPIAVSIQRFYKHKLLNNLFMLNNAHSSHPTTATILAAIED